jgi:hypothetical protein
MAAATTIELFSDHWVLAGARPPEVSRRHHVLALVLQFEALTLMPLVALTLVEGTTLSGPHPLLQDANVLTRAVVGPLLLALGPVVDRALRRSLALLHASGLVNAREGDRIRSEIRRLHDSRLLAVALLGLALAATFSTRERFLAAPGAWQVDARGPELSLAGWWSTLISAPALVALGLRWLARLGLWGVALAKLASHVRPVALHPDLLGGLGPLTRTHRVFCAVLLALSAGLAGGSWEELSRSGRPAATLAVPAGVLAAVLVLAYVAPLLPLAPRLLQAKRAALARFSVLAARQAADFDRTFLDRGGAGEPLLDQPAFSAHIDLSSSFERLRSLRVLPVGLDTLVLPAGALALPFLAVFARDAEIEQRLRELAPMLLRLVIPE